MASWPIHMSSIKNSLGFTSGNAFTKKLMLKFNKLEHVVSRLVTPVYVIVVVPVFVKSPLGIVNTPLPPVIITFAD